MVPGSCQRRDDYYHEPRYARPRLLARSGAAQEDLTGFVRAWQSGQHRPLMPLSVIALIAPFCVKTPWGGRV